MLTAKDAEGFSEARDALQQGLQRLDTALAPTVPYFAGEPFHLVDCVYAPLFMRLALLKQTYGLGMPFSERMQAWSDALLALDVVKTSVVDDFPSVFANFLKGNSSYLLSQASV
jgi:glutathione S-transferase